MLPDGSIRDASEEAIAKSLARDESIKGQNFEKSSS